MLSEKQEKLIGFLRASEPDSNADEAPADGCAACKTEERMVPTRDGETRIYLHTPAEGRAPYPLFVNIHGGGFIRGHRLQDSVFSKNICCHAQCVVIDIDYAPAPERRYPYALNQCYDVVKWASAGHEALGTDPARTALCGHSAGGNLVAGIAILNNLRHDFDIALQILDYPCLDLYTPAQLKGNAYQNPQKLPQEIARLLDSVYVDDGYRTDPTAYARAARLYADAYIDEAYRLDPTASPLFAPDEMLAGLPEALIFTCGQDIWRDEAEAYAHRLLQAGVPVFARRFAGSQHGFVVRRNGQFEEAESRILAALGRM